MDTSCSDNDTYTSLCELAAGDDTVFETFKSDHRYTGILEHVSTDQGLQYFNEFKSNESILSCLDKFKKNDEFGGPNTSTYSFGEFSPTTLRYIKVLSDLSHHKLSEMDIIEIGGGYGGQYTALRQYAKPKSYTFIDLPQALKLQKKYIEKVGLDDIEVNFYSSDDFPTLTGDLLISNYAISECTSEVQDGYIEKVINNCKKGYITHNGLWGYSHTEFADILKHNVNVLEEIPLTYPHNVILTW